MRLAAPLVLAPLVALVAACGGAPAPRPAQAVAGPALDQAQVHRIVDDVHRVAAAADSAGDASALSPRVDGAAAAVRGAAYTVRAAVPTAAAPTAVGADVLRDAVPAATGWPRWFLAVTRSSADSVPQVLVLVQESARAQYHLRAAATLLPGTTLPRLAAGRGAAGVAVAAGSPGTAATSPQDALARYADVLGRGSSSRWSASTAPDAFARQVLAERDAERRAVTATESYASTHVPRAGAAWALRTRDGGSLVVGVLDGTRTFTPRAAGVDQRLTPDLAALAGRADAPSGLRVGTTEVVLLSVPRAGTTGTSARLALLAASRATTAVTPG